MYVVSVIIRILKHALQDIYLLYCLSTTVCDKRQRTFHEATSCWISALASSLIAGNHSLLLKWLSYILHQNSPICVG